MKMKRIIKIVCLFVYYSIAIRFPTQPMPGYKMGYILRRFLVKRIASDCGKKILVKQN